MEEAKPLPRIIHPVKSSFGLVFCYQSYLLRQGFNFSTIIIIQIVFMITNIKMSNSDPYEIFLNDSLITKGVPIVVLSLLALNLVINMIWWFIEIKYDLLFTKFKIFLSNYCHSNSVSKYKTTESSKPLAVNYEMNEEPSVKHEETIPN